MFKKSNRNFRTKKAEFDSNDESETVTISVLNKNKKPLVNNTVLSFENELNEDDSLLTEFKVKKSKESRRITKELKKSKKEKQRQTKIDNGEQLSDDDVKKPKAEILTSEDILFNEGIKGACPIFLLVNNNFL